MLRYQKCPKCGTPAHWKMLWFKSWILPEWLCQKCFSRLGFNVNRRVVAVITAIVICVTIVHFNLLGNSHYIAYLLLFALICYFSFRLLDGIELKGL